MFTVRITDVDIHTTVGSYYLVSLMDVSIPDLVTELQNLVLVVRSARSPQGRPVMLCQKSPKQVTVTKRGVNLLAPYEDTRSRVNPVVGHIIVKSLQTFIEKVETSGNSDVILAKNGDGAKNIILILHDFLRSQKNAQDSLGQKTEILRDLRRNGILRQIGQHIRQDKNVTHIQLRDESRLLKVFGQISQAFLQSRFPAHISQILHQNLTDFCTLNCQSSRDFVHLSRSLPMRCIEVYNEPVNKSFILQGFLVRSSQDVIGLKYEKVENCYNEHNEPQTAADKEPSRFLLWASKSENEEQHFVLDNTSPSFRLDDFVENQYQSAKSFLQLLTENSVYLIISTFLMPEFARPLLRELGISVVETVDLKEVENLATVANISVWKGNLRTSEWKQFDSNIYIGKLKIVPSKVFIGSENYIRLHLFQQKVFNLILCGSTLSACKEYSRAILDVVRFFVSTCLERNPIGNRSEFITVLPGENSFFEKKALEFLIQKPEVNNSVSTFLKSSFMSLKYENEKYSRNFGDHLEVLEARLDQTECALSIFEQILSIDKLCYTKKKVSHSEPNDDI